MMAYFSGDDCSRVCSGDATISVVSQCSWCCRARAKYLQASYFPQPQIWTNVQLRIPTSTVSICLSGIYVLMLSS